MSINKRFSFRRIFGVLALIYLAITLIVAGVFIVLSTKNNELSSENLITEKEFLDQGISLVFNAFFFYFTLNAFYWRIANREKAAKFLKPVGLGVLAQCAYHYLLFLLFNDDNVILSVDDVERGDPLPVGMMAASYLMIATFYVSISFLVAYLTSLRDARKQNQVLKQQKIQLELENAQANYKFLKSQINPHFLHNTLSFFYARSLPHSAELSEGILTLSAIMRYALSEGNAKEGRASLKDEVEHLQNVIRINQLRFNNKLNVQLQVEGNINGARIVPFVLITLVENALKHGDLKSAECPVVFSIHLHGKKFYFYSHNKKKAGAKEHSTGIGLDNIKKRLTLAYGNKCLLQVKDSAEYYTTELTIDPL
ncbi:signal transduction histidine kinase LytS [Flammeovirgaceae bacterium 311]|nr:signal transduction histidine kinase LytS [Flammeovirgaceae bacterium 311]